VRSLAVGLLVALAVALAACGGAARATSVGTATGHLTTGGVARTYLLHRPAHAPSGRLPLVIALHGGYISPQIWEASARLTPQADANGFLVAYPQAHGGIWDLGCCAPPLTDPDDVRFISDLIDHLVHSERADPRRVYVVGFSVGAGMAYRLACELAPKVAGIGSSAGYEYLAHEPCHPAAPVSVIEIHGTGDHYGGGCNDQTQNNRGCRPGIKGYTTGVRQLNGWWRGRDGCSAAHTAVTSGNRLTETWPSCRGGAAVRLITVRGLGHCYPRAGSCGGFDAAAEFWRFLSGHRKSA
jgi:polyhydroxybutyrate depolymerase